MPLDPSIPLKVKPFTPFAAFNDRREEIAQGDRQDRQLGLQEQIAAAQLAAHAQLEKKRTQDEFTERDARRLTNIAFKAPGYEKLLRSGPSGLMRATELLKRDIQDYKTRQAAGEDVDANESIELLGMLESGDVQGSVDILQGLVLEAERRGLMKTQPESEIEKKIAAVLKTIAPGPEQDAAILKVVGGDVKRETAVVDKYLIDKHSGEVIYNGQPVNPNALETKERMKLERDFRNDFLKESNEFKGVDSAFGRMNAIEDSAAGDMSLIFAFMRMLDPASTVREGEFALAEQTRGFHENIWNTYNKAVTGERLTDTQRNNFLSQAMSMYLDQAEKQRSRETEYGRIAELNSLNREVIVGESLVRDFGKKKSPANAAIVKPEDIRAEANRILDLWRRKR